MDHKQIFTRLSLTRFMYHRGDNTTQWEKNGLSVNANWISIQEKSQSTSHVYKSQFQMD